MNHKTQPLVTVAMSTYNVASYVDEALDCVLRQTYRSLEILCIDDMSTDGTAERLEAAARRDERVRVIRMPANRGLSVSRNRAVREARGEYLLMLDGDDLFDLSMVERAVQRAVERDADVVLWDYVTFRDRSEIAHAAARPSDLCATDPEDRLALLRRPAFTWTKLIRTRILRDRGITFPEGLTKQDIAVHWRLVTADVRWALLPQRLAFYRLRPSATTMRRDRSLLALAYVMDVVGRDLHAAGVYDSWRGEYLRSRLTMMHGMCVVIDPMYRAEAQRVVRERYDADARRYVHSAECALDLKTRSYYKMLDGDRMATAVYRLIMFAAGVYRGICPR